ncbi:MBL fold metallo-hydrolase [Paenibacillus sp. GSMTC-2017]|uniref:MBL fold metallo-hydrolase n=1 Tax=Paenibacillus sp. GSMTC-2017 TaxID=2794350 RepID=UPI0018D9DEEE|nr:MBL fold metallo-hydrolase [Paenibacillus sp. GSMTC-2017]MBH5318606.1 MBL fold metallo-hydrolase [Paenibacillus sp. GSMTC-2017]
MTTVKATGMEAKKLAQYVIDGKELFILDVRNESDYENWKVEGSNIFSINKPYFELLDGVDAVLELIPHDKEVLVVCAKEGSSVFIAEQLLEAGLSGEQVYYLKGGMKAWSEHMEPVKIGELKGGGAIYQFVRLGKGCLSYMVVSGGEAAVIDGMRMTDVYETFADRLGVVIKHTMDTHLHADHISGGRKLAEKGGAIYWLPPKDAVDVTFHYEKLEDGHNMTIGHTQIGMKALYSPGHTIGSTSFIVDEQYLLTGDILFVESIGRPDLAGQAEDWAGDLRQTLYERYQQLPQELIVLPAHFSGIAELGEGGRVSATLGQLFERNDGLQIDDETTFRREVTEHLPQHPHAYEQIRQINMGQLNAADEEQREMEIGPNRCAIRSS